MSELPPRIPRAEAVTPRKIEERLYDIGEANKRVLAEIEACDRELKALLGRNHELVSEYERLTRKLMLWDEL